MMKRFLNIIIKHKLAAVVYAVLIIISLSFLAFNLHDRMFITAKFVDLRPFQAHVNVYYNGFKIGKVIKVKPSPDYKYTVVTMVLRPLSLILPNNIQALLKREKKKRKEYDYIELAYPVTPSKVNLKNGDVIIGKTTIDLENFVSNQDPTTIQGIQNDISGTLKSLQTTVDSLGDLFIILQDVVQENRPNLLEASSNLAKTTENIRVMSVKFNGSVKENQLNNTTANIDMSSTSVRVTTENLQTLTENLNSITSNIDKTMPKIDCIISNTASISANINDITAGVAKNMRKPFGGIRVLFGRNADECSRSCR